MEGVYCRVFLSGNPYAMWAGFLSVLLVASMCFDGISKCFSSNTR